MVPETVFVVNEEKHPFDYRSSLSPSALLGNSDGCAQW
jgi:hypothetical protein